VPALPRRWHAAPLRYAEWSQTAHASIFSKAIDGLEADYQSKSSILRHTLGYDTNAARGQRRI